MSEFGECLATLFDPEDDADCPPLTDAAIAHAENLLGYSLPKTYLQLLTIRNGGSLERSTVPTAERTSWAEDHVLFDQIFGIGGDEGIDSPTGSRYLIEEWGYPDVGIVIGSNGHTAFMLDYSECGPNGEPRVIWVDVESEDLSPVIFLAPNFESFVRSLR